MSPRLAQSRRAFVAAWILLAAFLVLRTAGRDRGVITDHIEFGRRLLAGLPLYAPYLDYHPLHPVYPPSFGLLTGPFSWLPERGALDTLKSRLGGTAAVAELTGRRVYYNNDAAGVALIDDVRRSHGEGRGEQQH